MMLSRAILSRGNEPFEAPWWFEVDNRHPDLISRSAHTVGERTHSREFIIIMTHLCTRLKQRALLCSKRIIPLGGLVFTLVSVLWLCLPAKAIDPARLHMKPFGHPASLNQILAPTLRSPVQQHEEDEAPLIELFATGPQWRPLGPSPIPNGQTFRPT